MNEKFALHLIVLTISTLLVSCQKDRLETYFPYNLEHEDELYTLPGRLAEISGLTHTKNREAFCLEDENGRVYKYDFNQKKITGTIDFAKKGDFEGIALAKSEIYALKSNGTLYHIFDSSNSDQRELNVEKITTFLNEKYDAEGLCYDSPSNSLLIACKGKAGSGKEFKNKKAVYAFDLLKQKLEKDPIIVIDVEDVQKMKRISGTQKAYEKFISTAGKNITFNPSAIAIHPKTHQVYILSSVGNTLLVTKSDGELLYAVHLSSNELKQPEGITFDDNGAMYIANEGQGGKANIKVYYYRPETIK